MKRGGNLLLIAGTIIVLSVLLMGFGCSRNKDGVQNAKVKEVEKAVSDLEQEQSAGTGSQEEVAGTGSQEEVAGTGSQEDDQCKQHRYYAAPGESVSVTFERLVDGKTAKAAGAEEPEFRKRGLEQQGYSATYVSRSVDSFAKPSPVWIVYHPMFGKREGEPTANAVSVGDLLIVSDGSGGGIINSVHGTRGAGAVGRLSREELTKKLNGKSTIRLRDYDPVTKMEKGYYDLAPERKTVDLEFHILSVSLSIEGPTEVGPTERKAYGEVAWKKTKVGFSAAYDRAKGKYAISGPAMARDCIKDPSE